MHDKIDPDKPGTGDRIEPAKIDLSHVAAGREHEAPQRAGSRRFVVLFSLVVLLLVAAGVIFILPGWTPEPALPDQTAPLTTNAASGTAQVKPAASPWTEAQLARARKESQDILEDMLKLQDELETIHVKQWAQQDYQQALNTADEGDAAYRQRDFEQAKSRYEAVLAQFKQLLARSETLYTRSLEDGMQALAQGDAGGAEQAFDKALLIKPEDAAATAGIRRTRTLDQVFKLMQSGDDHVQADRLEEARKDYQQALTLDPETRLAKEKLEQVDDRINEREFKQSMTVAYDALEHNHLQEARSALLKADKIRPGAGEVKTALEQVDNRITSGKITALLQQAQNHEQQEQWLDAVQAYDQALALDVSLLQARQGRQLAQTRSNLDARLNMAISKPERLSSREVYNEAMVLLRDAQRINSPGARLKRQITVLGSVLQEAASPIQVTLQSDNATEINLYKVGNLGHFLQKELSLLPGRYVAVGQREGFRDVRVEFVIEPDKNKAPVIIQCEEAIALGK